MNATALDNRTYSILSKTLKAKGLPVSDAYEWFKTLDIHTRRDAQKSGVVKFILANVKQWAR